MGRSIARLRSERNWSQEFLATRLQCEGVDVSRDMLARIELGLTKVSDEVIMGLQRVFRIPIIRLFPKAVQDLDEKFAQRVAAQLANPTSAKKPRQNNSRCKCQKLTKKRPPI